MKSIDFLPDIYRQRDALRRARIWWAMVVVIFGSALGASALAQVWLRHGLQQQLDSLAAEYAAAQTQVQELSALQAKMVRAGNDAGLYTFLENPWPRTQLLAEVVKPLPDSITLTKLYVIDEEQAKTAVHAGPRNTKADEESAAKASPPERDLAKIREEIERRQTTIEIDGFATDMSKLHAYVAEINRSPLLTSAAIKSWEAADTSHQARTRFTLRLIVRPGYCLRSSETAGATPERQPATGGGG